MNNDSGWMDQLGVWALGAVAAAVAFVMLMVLGSFAFPGAAFIAAFVFLGVGGLLAVVAFTPLPKPGEVSAPGPKPTTKPMSTAAPKAPTMPKAAAAPVVAPVAAPAAAPAPVAKEAPKKTAAPKAKPKAKAKTAPKAKAPAPTEAAGGSQPEALAAARDGGPDNLKEIKGVGPKLETLCHDLGIYHFDQIAGWGPAEVAWMDENLKGFKGRVTRDEWVKQAKILAAGGDTEFSKRVDEGDVY